MIRFEVLLGRVWRRGPAFAEVIRPWGSRARALRAVAGGSWHEFSPAIDVARVEAVTQGARAADYPGEADACRFLVESIPEAARSAVRLFSDAQWDLLQLANRCGQAFLDVAASNPGLAYLLAQRRWFEPLTLARVRELLGGRRGQITGALGFGESEDAVRLLARLPHAALTLTSLRHLRDSLWLDGCHQPPRKQPTAVRPLAAAPSRRGEFLEPPLAAMPGIEPLSSAAALAEEGRLMENCPASLRRRVLSGGCYFYRMTAPERATVCVRPAVNGWRLEELRGPRGRAVQASTERLARQWVAAASGGAPALAKLAS